MAAPYLENKMYVDLFSQNVKFTSVAAVLASVAFQKTQVVDETMALTTSPVKTAVPIAAPDTTNPEVRGVSSISFIK